MGDNIYGKPPIPPAIKHKKPIVTRFDGWIVRNASAKGGHQFVIGVAPAELYKAMLMTNSPMLLHFEVYGSEAVVSDTELAEALGLQMDNLDDELRNALDMTDNDDG